MKCNCGNGAVWEITAPGLYGAIMCSHCACKLFSSISPLSNGAVKFWSQTRLRHGVTIPPHHGNETLS